MKAKEKRTHLRNDIFYTFDIETTTLITGTDEDGSPIREAIIWSGQFYDGKTYTQLRSLKEVIRQFEIISDENKDQAYKVACFVHNLSYEFQFIKDFFHFDKILATSERKIISAETDQIVFRCSYFLSNMSLAKFMQAENVPEEYQKTEMDYDVQRFPWTEITPEEYTYCKNDVVGLHLALENAISHESRANINYLPLTSTGYVRRDCRNAVNSKKTNKYRFYKERLDPETFIMCHKAFRGGNTHANKDKANIVQNHVGQEDIRSSYPAQLLLYNYPTKFFDLKPFTRKEFNFYLNNSNRFALLFEVAFYNLRLKNERKTPVPYISVSKNDGIRFHNDKQNHYKEVDNGRVLSCEYIFMTITEIDYQIICDQYEWDDEKILKCKVSVKRPIIKELRDQILYYYTQKTELKQDPEDPNFSADKEYFYNKSKNKLNGIYGMHVTNPCKNEYEMDNDTHMVYEIEGNVADQLEEYYNTYSNFLSYQVGVWVTAYARAFLQKAIDLLQNKENPDISDLIYCDTDSIKYLNPESHRADIDKLNEEIIALAEKRKAYIDYNNKRYYLGVYENEGVVDFFKTFGAKKYLYGSSDHFKITIAGVPKVKGHDMIVRDIERGKLKDPFDIEKGYVFHAIKSTSEYRDHTKLHELEIEGHKVYYGSNIALYPASYTLGLTYDYEMLLNAYGDLMED